MTWGQSDPCWPSLQSALCTRLSCLTERHHAQATMQLNSWQRNGANRSTLVFSSHVGSGSVEDCLSGSACIILVTSDRVRGPSRSLEMSPCDRAHMTSYWRSIITMAVSRVISEILNVENVVTLKLGSEVTQGHWKWCWMPFWKFFRYISAENHPISTKFGVQMHILVLITATLQNIKILQIQYGGRPPYWKSFFGYISPIYCPINAKFGMKKQDHVRHRSHDQNAKFRKFKMADGRHFENGLIAISQYLGRSCMVFY